MTHSQEFEMRKILTTAAAVLALTTGTSLAATDADCLAMFEQTDTDKNGSVSMVEGKGYVDALANAGKVGSADQFVKQDVFMSECKADTFKNMQASGGAAPGTAPAQDDAGTKGNEASSAKPSGTAAAATAPVSSEPASANTTTAATPAVEPVVVPKPATSADKSGLLQGANSFTETQARARIEEKGFSAVTGLKLDDTGIWRATATMGGKSQMVGLDYQGTIAAQ
jgi:hypothetical protein